MSSGEPPVGAADAAVVVRARLDRAEIAAVRQVVQAAADADGVPPLSEHVTLHLTHGGDHAGHNVLVAADGRLAGYAHLDVTDPVEGASAELVVAPAYRGQGIGKRLVERLTELSPDGRLRLWAHGNHPGADALAARLGFRRSRMLWQLRRSLHAPLPEPELPPDVSLRTFVPGRDDERWVALNNRAFAGHPEQGRWTVADLRMRQAEPWFDPRGFFLAERDGELVGFHWTKVHGGRSEEPAAGDADGGAGAEAHAHDPIGEVYVVGVDPSAHGRGLGRALTIVGLRHLRSRCLGQAMLYVDDGNTAALRLYEGLGFTRWSVDVCYTRSISRTDR